MIPLKILKNRGLTTETMATISSIRENSRKGEMKGMDKWLEET